MPPDDRGPCGPVSLDNQEDKPSGFVRFLVKDLLPTTDLSHKRAQIRTYCRDCPHWVMSMLAALSLTKGFADSTGPLDLPFEIAGRRESIEKGKAVPEVRDISASDVALLGDESATSS